MLKRKVYADLLKWKNDPNRKALVVKGQRQIGKTYVIHEFGKREYGHLIEFNLSLDKKVRMAFEGDLRVDEIVRGLMAYHEPSDFVPGDTLIFFDEVQDCPDAWASLKAFQLDGRYDVVASGSMLGIDNNMPGEENEALRPTGYQTFIEMNPMDFEEFLWACGVPEDDVRYVREALGRHDQISPAVHQRISDLFREYMIVGGMPEAVQKFVDNKDYRECVTVLGDLLEMCHTDINRYNRGVNKVKTSDCFNAMSYMLSQSNKKFMYSRIDGEGSRKSAEKYKDNILWIRDSGLGLMCRNLSQPALPLESNVERNSFRMYMSDNGLLMKRFGLPAIEAVRCRNDAYNCGAIMENQIATCLHKCGYPLYYMNRSSGPSKMELDFVIETMKGLVVIEVKSGKTRDAPSISKLSKFYKSDHRVVLEESQCFTDEDGMEHMPLYAAAFFDSIWNRPFRTM